MRVMGLDVGSKTVGVAISDPLGFTAQGVEIIKIDEEAEEFGFDRLGELVKEYKVEKFQRYNEKLEKIINAGYSEVYIIGHSMGGVIASYLASKYKQVKKLVLAAPAFHYLAFKGDKVDVLESIKKLPNLFKNYNPEEVLSRLFKVPAPTIREFMKLVEEHTGDVKNITCPTLILHGDKDDIVPYDSVLYVYDNIKSKSVTLIELKTLTHDLFMNDRYEEVKGLIIKFFKTIPSNKKIQKKI